MAHSTRGVVGKYSLTNPKGRLMDLFQPSRIGENTPEFSVSEISTAIKRVIEGEFDRVRIKGEVGRVSRPRSGHVYLDLKDDRSVLSAVIWRRALQEIALDPEEGLEVVASGRLTTYAGQSRYQLVIEKLQLAGAGAMMMMLEKRKAKLAAEGLFAQERKKPLPYLPNVIGIVTSSTGAVIRDILHRFRDRFPRQVLVWPVSVQGSTCAKEVSRAIAGFNQFLPNDVRLPRPDLLIVARGGGSVEDLWGFNEENVARAVANSEIVVISAVGHETDVTLIDFVADVRAPTPTAAAELAVPVRANLLFTLDELGLRNKRGITTGLKQRRQRLRDLDRILPRANNIFDMRRQRLDITSEKFLRSLTHNSQTRRAKLEVMISVLRSRTIVQILRNHMDRTASLRARLKGIPLRIIQDRRENFDQQLRRLNHSRPSNDMTRYFETLMALSSRLDAAKWTRLKACRTQLDSVGRMHASLDYQATLERGYAIVRKDGRLISSKVLAEREKSLEIEFADGKVEFPKKPIGG
ncbi:MAG: exodeoxyribonuclease VII large subunit [Aestuariivita sp.]|nr:exodeoxyribonuclease VII large subunit [Aestuariivita sp.]MCY4345293.1 exodeoxyribonuclease VII large subunit [Aestuariivita sp.]